MIVGIFFDCKIINNCSLVGIKVLMTCWTFIMSLCTCWCTCCRCFVNPLAEGVAVGIYCFCVCCITAVCCTGVCHCAFVFAVCFGVFNTVVPCVNYCFILCRAVLSCTCLVVLTVLAVRFHSVGFWPSVLESVHICINIAVLTSWTGVSCEALLCTCGSGYCWFVVVLECCYEFCTTYCTCLCCCTGCCCTGGVSLCCNCFCVCCTTAVCCTGVCHCACCCTSGSSCLNTFIPCVSCCCAVFVTAVYALEGVSCILAVSVRLDCTCVGVLKLSDYKCACICLAVGCILFCIACKVEVTCFALLVCIVTCCKTGCCLCCGCITEGVSLCGDYSCCGVWASLVFVTCCVWTLPVHYTVGCTGCCCCNTVVCVYVSSLFNSSYICCWWTTWAVLGLWAVFCTCCFGVNCEGGCIVVAECTDYKCACILLAVGCILFCIACKVELTYCTLLVCIVTCCFTGCCICCGCCTEGVALCCDVFCVCCTTAVCCTCECLCSACDTGWIGINYTAIPCVLNCCILCSTAGSCTCLVVSIVLTVTVWGIGCWPCVVESCNILNSLSLGCCPVACGCECSCVGCCSLFSTCCRSCNLGCDCCGCCFFCRTCATCSLGCAWLTVCWPCVACCAPCVAFGGDCCLFYCNSSADWTFLTVCFTGCCTGCCCAGYCYLSVAGCVYIVSLICITAGTGVGCVALFCTCGSGYLWCVAVTCCTDSFSLCATTNWTSIGLNACCSTGGSCCLNTVVPCMTFCSYFICLIRVTALWTGVGCVALSCTCGSGYYLVVAMLECCCKFCTAYCTCLCCCTGSFCTGGVSVCGDYKACKLCLVWIKGYVTYWTFIMSECTVYCTCCCYFVNPVTVGVFFDCFFFFVCYVTCNRADCGPWECVMTIFIIICSCVSFGRSEGIAFWTDFCFNNVTCSINECYGASCFPDSIKSLFTGNNYSNSVWTCGCIGIGWPTLESIVFSGCSYIGSNINKWCWTDCRLYRWCSGKCSAVCVKSNFDLKAIDGSLKRTYSLVNCVLSCCRITEGRNCCRIKSIFDSFEWLSCVISIVKTWAEKNKFTELCFVNICCTKLNKVDWVCTGITVWMSMCCTFEHIVICCRAFNDTAIPCRIVFNSTGNSTICRTAVISWTTVNYIAFYATTTKPSVVCEIATNITWTFLFCIVIEFSCFVFFIGISSRCCICNICKVWNVPDNTLRVINICDIVTDSKVRNLIEICISACINSDICNRADICNKTTEFILISSQVEISDCGLRYTGNSTWRKPVKNRRTCTTWSSDTTYQW